MESTGWITALDEPAALDEPTSSTFQACRSSGLLAHAMRTCRAYLNYHSNFENFGSAMLTLVRVGTLDAWAELLTDLTVQPPLCDKQLGNCGQSMPVVSLFFGCFVLLVRSGFRFALPPWHCPGHRTNVHGMVPLIKYFYVPGQCGNRAVYQSTHSSENVELCTGT